MSLKNKIILMLLVMIMSCNAMSLQASADVIEHVVAEKVWRITMDAKVLNTEENLKYISVINQETNKPVAANVNLNDSNFNIIEVSGDIIYTPGNYELIVKKGLKSATGAEVLKDVVKPFTVSKSVDVSMINGVWSTYYEYEGMSYDIEVSYNNGNAYIILTDLVSGFKIHENKLYTVENSYMEMNVEELGFKVSGLINIYSDKEFKVISKSGKYAYFYKIK